MVATKTVERIVVVEPGSELARALDEARGATVVLIHDGERYRVTAENIWATYDPERAREALRRSAGALSPEVAEALKAELRAERGHGDPMSQ